MADPDFESGFEQGKRAAKTTAGWAAGLGSAVLGPLARGVGNATRAAQERAHLKQQQALATRLAHDRRIAYLRAELARVQAQKRPIQIRYVLLSVTTGVVCAIGAFAAIPASPDRWKAIAFFAALGVVAGVVISANIRNQGVRRLKKELHLPTTFSIIGTAVLIFLILAIGVVFLIAP